jgi:hypothetical protein
MVVCDVFRMLFYEKKKKMGCPPEPAPLKNGAGMTMAFNGRDAAK